MSNENKANEENQRRQFSPEQKIKILRQHLLEKTPISEVCEQHQITPTQFYQWRKTLFENGPAAFARTSGRLRKLQRAKHWRGWKWRRIPPFSIIPI